MTVPFHPLANLFPLIEGREFDELVADVRAYGVREAVQLFEGKILEGRNRYRAAGVARVPFPVETYLGDDPLAFVLSLNLRRRHLRDSQRALIAARIATLPQGRPSEWKNTRRIPTQSEAAEMLGVSVRSVHRARTILQNARPELLQLVARGEVSLLAADRIAMLSAAAQLDAVEGGPRRGVSMAHRNKAGGSRGRTEFADLWRHVDAICNALEDGNLGEAGTAVLKLSTAIGGLATKRRAA